MLTRPALKPCARWILPAFVGASTNINAGAEESGTPLLRAGFTIITVIIIIEMLFLLALLRKAGSGGNE